MTSVETPRKVLPDGRVSLTGERCAFTFHRFAPGALEVVITGIDSGELGTAPLDEISMALVRERPLELFVDASDASMPAVSVSKEWTRFFALNQKDLKRVSVLVSSKSVELTIAIAQHLVRAARYERGVASIASSWSGSTGFSRCLSNPASYALLRSASWP
jgi:hypothetical protein